MGSMGGGGGATTTVEKSDPWEGQQPYLKDIFAQAQDQYQTGAPEYYPGQTLAPYSGQEQMAQGMAEGFALGPAQGFAQDTMAANQFALGDAMYADSNPYLQSAARGAIQPVTETLMRDILPGIRQGAVQAGQYGGTRQDLATSGAIDKAIEDMLNTTSGMYSQGYGQGLDAMTKGLALAPQTMQVGAMPAEMLGASGAMDRNMLQSLMNEEKARWDFQQQVPSTMLSQYQQLIQGGYGGSSSAYSDAGGGSDLSNALGGAMSGYAMAGMMPALGMTGPVGAGIGALMAVLG